MHSSARRSSLTGPEWRCVYCGTIHKSFIITVLPQPWLTLCHHDNHCVSLCFQAPRTGLSQILLLYSWSFECWFDGWMKGTPRGAESDLDKRKKTNKWVRFRAAQLRSTRTDADVWSALVWQTAAHNDGRVWSLFQRAKQMGERCCRVSTDKKTLKDDLKPIHEWDMEKWTFKLCDVCNVLLKGSFSNLLCWLKRLRPSLNGFQSSHLVCSLCITLGG